MRKLCFGLALIFYSSVGAAESFPKFFDCFENNSAVVGHYRIKIEKGQAHFRLQYYLVVPNGGSPVVRSAIAEMGEGTKGDFKPIAEDPWQPGVVLISVSPDMINGGSSSPFFQFTYGSGYSKRSCKVAEAWDWGSND